MSLNKVTLIGNLGQDPEIKTLSNGTMVTGFSLATSESYKKDGNKVTNTEWHRITLFDKQAEIAGKYLKKGSKIYLEGKIKSEKWTDKDGVEKTSTKIVGNHFLMLDSRTKEEAIEAGVQEISSSVDDSDLPF